MPKPQSSPLLAGFPALPLLVPPILAAAFQQLGVGASTYVDGVWRSLHVATGLTDIEAEQGAQPLRHRYNERCLAEVKSTRRMLRGEHGGFHDVFLPITTRGVLRAILIVGPVASGRPSGAEVAERWFRMTRVPCRLADPGFARYLAVTLDTLTLEAGLFAAFERMLVCFADIVASRGNTQALVLEAENLRLKLLGARRPEEMWTAANSMVDERTAHSWHTGLRRDPLRELGLVRPPRHALVGLLVGRGSQSEPVEEALARAAFQRAAADFAKRRGHVVSGRVGDRGITLLTDSAETGVRARNTLTDLGQRMAQLAKAFGFKLHLGAALATGRGSLATRYRTALGAAEKALSRGVALEFGSEAPGSSGEVLRQLRTHLGLSVEGPPAHLALRFERYLDAVLADTGYRAELARGHIQLGLERLAEPLLSSGALQPKSFDEILRSLDATRDSDSISELVLAYRRIVAELERAVAAPKQAHHERSMRRALEFVEAHLAEPLTLREVARVAGFAPNYFSALLKQEEGLAFEYYLQSRRLERAKKQLVASSMSAGRVAQLCGFRSRTYFQRLFKLTTGKTPERFRTALG
jgi:AraC-like DNA-binding protein